MAGEGETHLHDLPEAILSNLFALVEDTRTRNRMALVCRRWYTLERFTRSSLCLRGNVRDLFLLPTCFASVTHLDLSHLSPWGHPFLLHHHHHHQREHPTAEEQQQHHLIALLLCRAFPNLTSLTVYARHPSTLQALAPQWPALRHAKLVRWHQRPPHHPHGADLAPLLAACPSLHSLDLSQFYCWAEDVPPALHAFPATAASLVRLDLLRPVAEGFRASELVPISAACPNLRYLLAPCVFDSRYIDSVGDEALVAVATNCPRLSLLHLADPSAVFPAAHAPDAEGFAPQDARITAAGLEVLFAALPLLEDLALDLCQNVRDAGPALETLSERCPRIESLRLGGFHGVCRGAGLRLDGVAVCGRLESLCIKNSADLTDAGLVAIARGCSRLSKLEIHGCKRVTESGLKKMTGMLRWTLVDIGISRCEHLDAPHSLRAVEPIRDRIKRLHIDCIWAGQELEHLPDSSLAAAGDDLEWNELEQDIELEASEESDAVFIDFLDVEDSPGDSLTMMCRRSEAAGDHRAGNSCSRNGIGAFWCREWKQLRHLSLWVPAGELLIPLVDAGLDSCPELEEICIKVEGDCRTCPMPSQEVFGLSSLACYPKLSKMKLDCRDVVGYALTAPTGRKDLSSWERFYLHGMGDLNLCDLDYWPPQDRDVNLRSLFLPAAGLLQGCITLRKLFIHGTANEHFMRFFLAMPNLRDVQLREDYYPAPEYDMSTEIRVDSCSRFEDALRRRPVPD
ncbi:F-box protein MAX2 homolog A-like [Elaeis guineensis]|uniref:F-box/LRR-repeat MAX2 homolog A-like n=1 Tax=Elaeis guineensis var. tenera TaxID=51953 RepID=A0A6I9R400_ELAGV|nr:F-box/LRR-repeat MAX2 homolog A-like [Elaeis guineensis]